MQKLSIVIPCHNEEATVALLLERVCAFPLPEGWEREVIVVDDASTDGTRDLLVALADRLPIRVLARAANGGKGTALVDGFKEATGTHLLIQDADLEYDPEDIPTLLAAVDGPRVAVFGSRYLAHRGRRGGPVLRAGVWLITEFINLLYGTKLTDACTCYKLFPKQAAPLFTTGGFAPDTLIGPALVRAGYDIREVPVSYHARSREEGKKIKYADGFHIIGAILADYLAARRRRAARP